MADQPPQELHYEMTFSSKGIFLKSGEPLSEHEAAILRNALDRYLLALGPDDEAFHVAYNRFVGWASSFIAAEEEENGGTFQGFHNYEEKKRLREERIDSAAAWDLQFETREEQARVRDIQRIMQEAVE